MNVSNDGTVQVSSPMSHNPSGSLPSGTSVTSSAEGGIIASYSPGASTSYVGGKIVDNADGSFNVVTSDGTSIYYPTGSSYVNNGNSITVTNPSLPTSVQYPKGSTYETVADTGVVNVTPGITPDTLASTMASEAKET